MYKECRIYELGPHLLMSANSISVHDWEPTCVKFPETSIQFPPKKGRKICGIVPSFMNLGVIDSSSYVDISVIRSVHAGKKCLRELLAVKVRSDTPFPPLGVNKQKT